MFLLPHASAQRKEDVGSIPFSPAPYRVGEHLTYNVSFSNFISAAHVELLIAERGTYAGREGLMLRAHVETTGVVNAALYSINNDYTTYIDPATGLPFRTQQVVREGGRTSDTSSEYNEPVGTAAIPSKLRTGEFPGTFDFLSAIYRVRALPLAAKARYYFTVRGEQVQYDAQLRVTGRGVIKTNVGSFPTIATEIRVSNNSEANNYNTRIYFSDDERHVPVLITATHPNGEIRAELVGSELPEVVATPMPTPVATPKLSPTVKQNPVVPLTPRQTAPRPTPTPTPRPQVNLSNLPFEIGEQLNYNIFLANSAQPVATASFQVRERANYFNRNGLLLTVRAQTLGTIARAFFANDQINSYVDPVTLLPFRTELNLIEGRRRTTAVLSLDQEHGVAQTDKGPRMEVPVGTHDILSVLYALRSFNLTPPKRNAVSLIVNNRPLTLFITALRRETIEIGGQRIPTVLLSLTTDDPQPDKYGLRLWVGEDRRRIPLRAAATTELGAVRADLAILPSGTRQ